MTEITDNTATTVLPLADMPAATRRFVLQWGDMGGQWGVNRSVAQIHALLYLAEKPMNAEDIAATLGIARSNVSNSLKELQNWQIISREPVPGDRRDHFVAETDVWDMAMRIAAVRKQKEIDPAISTLETCLEEADGDTRVSEEVKARLERMLDFTRTMDKWYDQMLNVPNQTLIKMIRMGNRIVGLLGFGSKDPDKTAGKGGKDKKSGRKAA